MSSEDPSAPVPPTPPSASPTASNILAGIIKMLGKNLEMTQTAMAEEFGIGQSRIAYHIKKLVRLYAEASTDADDGEIDYSKIISEAGDEVTEKDIEKIEPFLERQSNILIKEMKASDTTMQSSTAAAATSSGGGDSFLNTDGSLNFGAIKTKDMAMQAVLSIVPGINSGQQEMILGLYRSNASYNNDPIALFQLLLGLLGKEKGYFAWYNYMLITNQLQKQESHLMSEFYSMVGGQQPVLPGAPMQNPFAMAQSQVPGLQFPMPPGLSSLQQNAMMGMIGGGNGGFAPQPAGNGMNPMLAAAAGGGMGASPLAMMAVSNPSLMNNPMFAQLLAAEMARMQEEEKERKEDLRMERQMRMMSSAATMSMMSKAMQERAGGELPPMPGMQVITEVDPQTGATKKSYLPVQQQGQANDLTSMMIAKVMDMNTALLTKKEQDQTGGVMGEVLKALVGKAMKEPSDGVTQSIDLITKLKQVAPDIFGNRGASVDELRLQIDSKLAMFDKQMQFEKWRSEQAAAQAEKQMQHENAKEYIGGIKQAAETIVKPIVTAVTQGMTRGGGGGAPAGAAAPGVPTVAGRVDWGKIPDAQLAELEKERDAVFQEMNQKMRLLQERSVELESEKKRREAMRIASEKSSAATAEMASTAAPSTPVSTENPYEGGYGFAVGGG